MRQYISISTSLSEYQLIERLVHLSAQWGRFALLDSNGFEGRTYDFLAGIDALETTVADDWRLGYIGYDFKNRVEQLTSNNADGLGFEEMLFFTPRFMVIGRNGGISIGYRDEWNTPQDVEDLMREVECCVVENEALPTIDFRAKVSRAEYVERVMGIQEHIHRGDLYEMNFCMEFFADDVAISAPLAYCKLKTVSPTPFAGFFKDGDRYIISASPERFIKRRGNRVVSEPIKGTIARGADEAEDLLQREKLRSNLKEQSENVMIVDLVRNDLSRIATRGSVKVEELMGIYPFRHLFQMISTISAEVKPNTTWEEIIRATFPMGSMTGAPKISAMLLIEEFESTKRGAYSGTMGYIAPDGDFDFNVIIRTLLYNAENRYLSFMVGSAITANAVAEQEYEECLLKATGMRGIFK